VVVVDMDVRITALTRLARTQGRRRGTTVCCAG